MEVNGHDSPSHHIIPRATTFHTMRNNPSTRLTAIILFLMEVLTLHAQTTMQRGVTYRYNGKKPHTVIGGVYVKTATAAQGTVSDEKSGEFQLTLHNVSLGMPLGKAVISKEGMMVFNQQAVDEWDVRKTPLRVILCDREHFTKQKQQLIAYGKSQARRKYERQMAELKRLNQANKIMKDAYYAKIDSLQKELDNAHQHIDEYADRFARIDESELDTIAQHAMDLFNQGEIDAAIRTFESGDYVRRLDNAIAARDMAHQRRLQEERNEERADDDVARNTRNIEAEIEACKLANEWQKAAALLKTLADKTKTLGAIEKYALFCHKQNIFDEAEKYLRILINRAEPLAKEDNPTYVFCLATAQTDLATLYNTLSRYTESEELYNKALDAFDNLNKTNIFMYASYYIQCKMLTGNLYHNTRQYTKSEKAYKEAIATCEFMYNTDTLTYAPILAGIKINLGNLYKSCKRFNEAETVLLEALEFYGRKAKENPSGYEETLSLVQDNLATVYRETGQLEKSEEMYKKLLAMRQRLAKQNPYAYTPLLAFTKMQLGTLYRKMLRFAESEAIYNEAIELYEQISANSMGAYDVYKALTYGYLGQIHLALRQIEKSIAAYEKARDIYDRLIESGQHEYKADIMGVWATLALEYLNIRDYRNAYDTYVHLLPGLFKLYNNGIIQKADFVQQLTNQAFCANVMGRFEESEKYSRKALETDSTCRMAYTNFAAALLLQGRYEEAKGVYLEIKDEFKTGLLADLDDLASHGAIPKERENDVEKIRKLLSE